METFYTIIFVGLLVLQIVMIVKFFQIASGIKNLKERADPEFIPDHFQAAKPRLTLEYLSGNTIPVIRFLILEFERYDKNLKYYQKGGYENYIEKTQAKIDALREFARSLGIDIDDILQKYQTLTAPAEQAQ